MPAVSFEYTSPKKVKIYQNESNSRKRKRRMSIVASGTGKLTPVTKKQGEELEKFYKQELEEAKRLEEESKANKIDISSIHCTRHESSFDFGSDGFIDLDEQEEGSNCNEDSGDDNSFETLDPNIVSQFIVDEQLTKHLLNANRKRENWGEFVTAVSGDLAFLSTNARISNSASISAENASSDRIPQFEFQPSARRPFNQSGSHCS